MKHILAIAAMIIGIQSEIHAQSSIDKNDFVPVCDSLAVLISEHSGVEGTLKLDNLMRRRGSYLDFYFNEYLGDFPWYKGDVKWLRKTLKSLFPEAYQKYHLGEIFSRKVNINKLELPKLS